MNWQYKIISILAVVAAISFMIPLVKDADNISLMTKMFVFSIVGSGYYIGAMKVLPTFIHREGEE